MKILKENISNGYLSKEAKKAFSITTGILGSVFFFGQMFLPFIVMVFAFPIFISSYSHNTFVDIETAVYWKNELWCVQKQYVSKPGMKKRSRLMSSPLSESIQPRSILSSSLKNIRLLPGNDRLWIISSDAVAFFRQGGITTLTPRQMLGEFSPPFLYGGKPAVIEGTPQGSYLRIFENGIWREVAEFNLISDENEISAVKNLKIISSGTDFFFFLKYGENLYFWKGIPEPKQKIWKHWQAVTKVDDNWRVIAVKGKPVVFKKENYDTSARIIGLIFESNKWQPYFTYSTPSPPISFNAVPLDTKGKYLLLFYSSPGKLQILRVNANQVEKEYVTGRNTFTASYFTLIVFTIYALQIIFPLILALLLSILMHKYRVSKYILNDKQCELAPLSRRVFSQITDLLILGSPAIIAYFIMLRNILTINPYRTGTYPLFFFAIMIVDFLYMVGCFLLFSFLEGRYGRTPGKWLFGIKVLGTELKPCGFGRAFLRNLLKCVDGFFNFMVGIILIALTENWQRIGDMAAQTIVIRAKNETARSK